MATILKEFKVIEAEPLILSDKGVGSIGTFIDAEIARLVRGEAEMRGQLISVGVEFSDSDWSMLVRLYGSESLSRAADEVVIKDSRKR